VIDLRPLPGEREVGGVELRAGGTRSCWEEAAVVGGACWGEAGA
jgi:hypothetical protein